MSAENELEQIKSILGQIRDQNASSSGVGSESSKDVESYARELKFARQELDLLDKGSSAYNRKQKEVEKLTRQTRNAMKDQRRETDLLSLSTNGLAGAMDMLGNALDRVVVSFAGLVSGVFDEAKKLDTLTVEFQRTTAASEQLASNIGALTDRLRLYGISSAKAGAAVKVLAAQYRDFTRLSSGQQDSIGETVVLMGELGISYEQSANIMEIATRSMNMSIAESQGLLVDLRRTSRALQVPIEQLTSDFLSAESRIVQMGRSGIQQFKDLEAAAKNTGVGVNDLIGIAKQFDTFEGAQRAAQRLNAILPGATFDSRTLLMLADTPVQLAEYLQNNLESAGLTIDDITGKGRRLGDAIGEAFGQEGATVIKLLSGDIEGLQGEVEKTTYSFEQMKTEAFGLKGFDEVMNNVMDAFKRPVSDIQQAARTTFQGLVESGIIGRFEKFNKNLIEKTSDFVNKNSNLVGAIGILYNLGNIDVVQQGYEIFKGIAGFTGTIFRNVFSLKGLLTLMVGGVLYSIRDSFADIKTAFLGPQGGFFNGISKFYDVIMDKYQEFKTAAIDMGFDKEFFDKGLAAISALAIEGYRFMNLHFLGPTYDFISLEFADAFVEMLDVVYTKVTHWLTSLMNTITQKTVQWTVEALLPEEIEWLMTGFGASPEQLSQWLVGESEAGLDVEAIKKMRTERREQELKDASDARKGSWEDFTKTKGATAIVDTTNKIFTQVAPHITKGLDDAFLHGGNIYNAIKDGVREGAKEGVQVLGELTTGVDAAHNRRQNVTVELNGRNVANGVAEHLLKGY